MVGLGTNLGQLLKFAFVFLVELVFERKVFGSKRSDLLWTVGFHLDLLHGDDVLFGKHSHVGTSSLLVDALAIGFGAECGSHEKDFTKLEIGIVYQSEVFFTRDDSTEQFFGLFEEVKPLVFVPAILGEHLASLRGERDCEKILATVDRGSGWKFLDILAEIRGSFLKVGDLIFAKGTAVVDGFKIGGLRIL